MLRSFTDHKITKAAAAFLLALCLLLPAFSAARAEGEAASVTAGADTQVYATLAEALAAIENNAALTADGQVTQVTLTLKKDVTLTEPLTLPLKAMTLDGGGFTLGINATAPALPTVTAGASLLLKNISLGTGASALTVLCASGKTLTLDAVTAAAAAHPPVFTANGGTVQYALNVDSVSVSPAAAYNAETGKAALRVSAAFAPYTGFTPTGAISFSWRAKGAAAWTALGTVSAADFTGGNTKATLASAEISVSSGTECEFLAVYTPAVGDACAAGASKIVSCTAGAVSTEAQLLSALAAAPTDGTVDAIYISGAITLSATAEIPAGAVVRLEGLTGAALCRAASFHGTMLNVPATAALSVKNVSVTGDAASTAAAVTVSGSLSLESGAKLQGDGVADISAAAAAAISASGNPTVDTLTLSGGTLTVSGALTAGASIGVTQATLPAFSAPVSVVTDGGAYLSEASLACFTTADSCYLTFADGGIRQARKISASLLAISSVAYGTAVTAPGVSLTESGGSTAVEASYTLVYTGLSGAVKDYSGQTLPTAPGKYRATLAMTDTGLVLAADSVLTRDFSITAAIDTGVTAAIDYTAGGNGSSALYWKGASAQVQPTVTATDSNTGAALVLNQDYTLSYGDNNTLTADASSVKISGAGAYSGEKTLLCTLTVLPTPQAPYTLSGTAGQNGWYLGSLTVAPAAGYTFVTAEGAAFTGLTDGKRVLSADTNATLSDMALMNAAGQVTAALSIPVKLEATLPVISAPTGVSETLSKNAQAIGFTVTAPYSGLSSVTVSGGGFSAAQTLTALADGSYTFSAPANGSYLLCATGLSGGKTEKTVVIANMDTLAPVLSALSPSGTGWTRDGVITLTADDAAATGASASSGIATYAYTLDGSTWSAETAWGTANTFTVSADGVYEAVRVRLTDKVGNVFTSAAFTVRRDSTAPTGKLTTPANGASSVSTSVSGNLVFTFSETVTAVSGKKVIIERGTSTFTADVKDAVISGTGSDCTASIPLSKFSSIPSRFTSSATYAVRVEAGAFSDAAGNLSALYSATFTTAATHSYAVTFSRSGSGSLSAKTSGGTALSSGDSVTSGTKVKFTFAAKDGWELASVTVKKDGTRISRVSGDTYTVDGDLSFTVKFTALELEGVISFDDLTPTVGEKITASVSDTNNTGTLKYTWKRNGVTVGTGKTYTVSGDDADQTLTCEVSSSHQTGNLYKTTVRVSKKAAAETAVAPTLALAEARAITLTAVEGYEYSKDGVYFQSSPAFSGLTPETEYTFFQRIAETEGAAASAPASAAFSTDAVTLPVSADTALPLSQGGLGKDEGMSDTAYMQALLDISDLLSRQHTGALDAPLSGGDAAGAEARALLEQLYHRVNLLLTPATEKFLDMNSGTAAAVAAGTADAQFSMQLLAEGSVYDAAAAAANGAPIAVGVLNISRGDTALSDISVALQFANCANEELYFSVLQEDGSFESFRLTVDADGRSTFLASGSMTFVISRTVPDAAGSPSPSADPAGGGKTGGSLWVFIVLGVIALGAAAGIVIVLKKRNSDSDKGGSADGGIDLGL